ncbi:MAG: SAM hydrolase/SAM-dependent halogenase family protein [Thermodesulfobacteriota bacterium]
MEPAAIITLTTDFGLVDEYVGVLKGVLLSRAPQARLVDISHGVEPQGIAQASMLLAAAAPYFPAGTIHLAVVDPGVGTSRQLIALRADGQFLVGPDNGIFTPFLENAEAVVIDSSRHSLKPVSSTFHGRDILAPAAAALANAVPLLELGTTIPVETLTKLSPPLLQIDTIHGTITGAVMLGDHFGNLTTNIHHRHLVARGQEPAGLRICLRGHQIDGLAATYGERPAGTLLALINSRGYLELAVAMGSAARLTGAANGDQVKVFLHPG